METIGKKGDCAEWDHDSMMPVLPILECAKLSSRVRVREVRLGGRWQKTNGNHSLNLILSLGM